MKKILALCLTVVLCLCCLASCGIFGAHSISYADKGTEKLLHDGYAPKRANPGDTVVLRAGPIMDADLDFYANGVKLENTHNDSDYWEYTFIMPDEDVVITHKMSGGFIQVKCEDHVDEDANGSCDNCGHRHTITYVSAGESGHFENYTCGCPHDHGAVPHYDEDIDLICDACGYDMNADYPPLVDVTASLTQFASWLTELNAENVAEIKTTFEYVGVAPGSLKDISRTTDKTVIADVLDKYSNTKMRPVAPEETYIDGGSAFTIEFTLTDGTVKQLHFNNGFYAYGLDEIEISALCYFELDSIPNLEGYNSEYAIPVSKFFGFITYIDTGDVYYGDFATIPEQEPESICKIEGIGEIGFISIDRKPDTLPELPLYCVETEFGTLQIFGAYNFSLGGTHYLRVDGGNLLDMIEDAIKNNDTKGLEYNN